LAGLDDFLGIVVRVSVTYNYALIILRVSGKRSLANLNPLDFVVALIIGDLFDDLFWAEVPLASGLVALATIFFWHILLAWLSANSQWFDHTVVGSKPAQLISNGKRVAKELQAQRISDVDFRAMLRLNQVETVAEVKEGNLEPSGMLSIIRMEKDRPVQKVELDG